MKEKKKENKLFITMLLELHNYSLIGHSLTRSFSLILYFFDLILSKVSLSFDRLFQLPIEPSEVGPVAVLPNEIFKFPREKPCPEPKGETSWEKFAKSKGIKKVKKERMIYDDTTKQFAPRYGYKGVNQGIEDQVIIEVKPGQDPNVDPWSKAKEEKKERINKNEIKRQRNIERNERGKGRGKKGKIESYGKIFFCIVFSSSLKSCAFVIIIVFLFLFFLSLFFFRSFNNSWYSIRNCCKRIKK